MSQPAGNPRPGPSDDDTRILRLPAPTPSPDDAKTGLIRRHPTGALPSAAAAEPPTSLITSPANDAATSYLPPARPAPATHGAALPDPRPAIFTATVSILSGWATSVIATGLISSWWRTDRLFCVAIGFLTAISAAATIGGVISVLLRRRTGRLLIVVGAVISMLIFGSLFMTGAHMHPVVYAMPVLPVTATVLALLPATGRWCARQ